MATNTSKVFIDIITQFTGTKSIKQAESSFNKLAKSVARFASAAAIEEFSRRSVKAFLADDAAAKQLEKTLSNLGIYFDSGVLSSYIQGLQDTTGVLDDQLRPAFSSLAVATGDYTKAQDLLNVALDVSQGTGKSLSATSQALSRAYLGNFTALSKLGAGVSKADIATGDFQVIVDKLSKTFKGSALAAADTYAGQLNKIKAAFTDVQETIGKGFIDAFATITGPGSSADDFKKTMQDTALAVADLIRGFGVIAAKFKEIKTESGFFGKLLDFAMQDSIASFIAGLGKAERLFKESFIAVAPEPAQIGYAKAAQDKKALALAKAAAAEEKKKADAIKKSAKAAADKLKTDKASKALANAGSIFDIDAIQIAAALAKLQTQGDVDRLKLKQQLIDAEKLVGDAAQRAADDAIILTQKILIAMGLIMKVDGSIVNLKDAKNPFAGFSDYVKNVLKGLIDIQNGLDLLKPPPFITNPPFVPSPNPGGGTPGTEFPDPNPPSNPYVPSPNPGGGTPGTEFPDPNPPSNPYVPSPNPGGGTPGTEFPDPDPYVPPYYDPGYGDAFGRPGAGNGYASSNKMTNPIIVNVLLDPATLTTVVTQGQQNTTASGVVVGTSRLNPLGGTGL